MAEFSAFLQEIRARHEHVIVASAGDIFTGNPYNDFFEPTQAPIVDMLNHIGVDISVLGNHEFNYGVDVLNDRIKELNGAVVAANIELSTSGLKGIKPYHIIKKNGINIAFLGLVNVEERSGKPATLYDRVKDIQFFSPDIALNYRYLRKKAHVFVSLSHIGIAFDRILADSLPELDLIIGGHSHTVLEKPEYRNGVLITQASRFAEKVGKTVIQLEKGVVTSITNELINLGEWDAPVDSGMVELIKKYEGDRRFEQPFVSLQHSIPNVEQLTYMVADAAAALPGVDFSLVNFSAVKIPRMPAGEVTPGDILRLSPSNNYLIVVELKPADIRALIGQRSDFISPAGFTYTARRGPGPEEFLQVEKLMCSNGEELDENRIYHMAIDNFLFSRHLRNLPFNFKNTGVTTVDNIINYLRDNPDVDYRNRPKRAKPIG